MSEDSLDKLDMVLDYELANLESDTRGALAACGREFWEMKDRSVPSPLRIESRRKLLKVVGDCLRMVSPGQAFELNALAATIKGKYDHLYSKMGELRSSVLKSIGNQVEFQFLDKVLITQKEVLEQRIRPIMFMSMLIPCFERQLGKILTGHYIQSS